MAYGTAVSQLGLVGTSTITATPTTQTQAAGVAPAGAYNICTVANASDAITLPKGGAGQVLAFKGGANAAKLFPPVGGKVNNGTVDAAFTLAATVSTLVFYVSELDVVAVQGAA